MANKTLDQITQSALRPGIFSLMLARDPDVTAPETLAFAAHFVMETIRDALTVKDTQTVDPTALSPTRGDAYVIGGTGAGAWVSHDNELTVFDGSGWAFATAVEGWTVYDQTSNEHFYYSGTAWLSLAPKSGTSSIAGGNSETAITFGTAYPDANYTPIAISVGGLSLMRIKAATILTTGFTVERLDTALQALETTGAETFSWIAIPHRDT